MWLKTKSTITQMSSLGSSFCGMLLQDEPFDAFCVRPKALRPSQMRLLDKVCQVLKAAVGVVHLGRA